MRKITVLSTQSYMEKIIEELHKNKVLHIIEHKKTEDLDIGSPLDQGDTISELLVKIRSLMALLKMPKGHSGQKNDDSYAKIRSEIDKTHKEVNSKLDDIQKIEAKIKQNQERIDELKVAEVLDLPLEAFADFTSISKIIGKSGEVERIAARITKITEKYELYTDEKGHMFALFMAKEHETAVREALKEEGILEISLDLSGMEGDAHSMIASLEKETLSLMKDKAFIEKRIESIRMKWARYAVSVENRLSEESEKADAPLVFAASENAFMVTGWVLEKKAEALRLSVEKLTRGKVYIRIDHPEKKDDIPVKLNNPKVSRSFEALLDLYALPLYKEIDPTFLIFLTFPILFGFMLGDWGYGITTLILFWSLKKMIPAGRQFFNILMLSSVSTILFGLLYGEFFGAEVLLGWDMPRILSRHHQIDLLLIVAIAIGVIHINYGLLIGFINEKRNHGFITAMYEKGSWIVLQIGVAMLALSVTGTWRLRVYVSGLVILLAVIMIYKGEGVQGLVELPGIFSNILSYARLMAVGLASVSLAAVINEFAGESFRSGGFGILVAILILVIGHTINIALGIIGPSLHSLRLHYVEFFTKFFKGGAKRFKPFGAKQ